MKIFFSICLAALTLAIITGCNIHFTGSSGWSDADLKATTNLVGSATIPGGLKVLDVNNAFGAIHVTGSDSGPFGWTQKLTVRAATVVDVQVFASNLVCQANFAGDRLRLAVTVPSSKEPHSFQSDLEITVPNSVNVRTHDQYGRTEITGLNGDVEVANQFGAVELRDLPGNVRAETSYAALKLTRTGSATLKNAFGAIEAFDVHGPLAAETSYGTLDARDIGGTVKLRNQFGRVNVERAGETDVKTSYADLRVKEITGDVRLVNQFGRLMAEAITGSVRAETSYAVMEVTGSGADFICINQFGAINVQATSAALTKLEARTSYAALKVRLPADLKPVLQAHTSYGNIDSDFPVLVKPSGSDVLAGPSAGAPHINLQNQNGSIRVVRE